jgi:hypothetical protein
MLYACEIFALDQSVPVLMTEFMATDDAAAISHALACYDTRPIAVHQGDRLIARIPAGSRGFGPIERIDLQSHTERSP